MHGFCSGSIKIPTSTTESTTDVLDPNKTLSLINLLQGAAEKNRSVKIRTPLQTDLIDISVCAQTGYNFSLNPTEPSVEHPVKYSVLQLSRMHSPKADH